MKERMEVALRVLAGYAQIQLQRTSNFLKIGLPQANVSPTLTNWPCMVINEEIQRRKNPRIMQAAAQ